MRNQYKVLAEKYSLIIEEKDPRKAGLQAFIDYLANSKDLSFSEIEASPYLKHFIKWLIDNELYAPTSDDIEPSLADYVNAVAKDYAHDVLNDRAEDYDNNDNRTFEQLVDYGLEQARHQVEYDYEAYMNSDSHKRDVEKLNNSSGFKAAGAKNAEPI